MPDTIEQVGGTGILVPEDLPALNEAVRRVLSLMRDGQWHSSEQIIAASGQREGLRRMRELRRWWDVQRRRNGEPRDFEYRLVEYPPPTPMKVIYWSRDDTPKSQQGELL